MDAKLVRKTLWFGLSVKQVSEQNVRHSDSKHP